MLEVQCLSYNDNRHRSRYRDQVMGKSTKLTSLMVKETSGVDHPAHLHEGWLVMKSEDLTAALTEIQAHDTEETHVDLTVTEPDASPDVEKAVGDDEIRKELTDLRKALEDSRRETESLRKERAFEKALEAAHAWAILPGLNPQEFAPVLSSLRDSSPAEVAVVEKILDASARALKEAGILTELGTSGADSTADAWSTIQARAQQMVNEGRAQSFAKAVTMIAESDKALYNQYLVEKGR